MQQTETETTWYKEAIIYQLHIKAFFDSNDDGIGDFRGLIEKLDYLADLGVTAIWLLPFYPSPLRDDGYDIADYDNVNPDYGTMDDFDVFLKEAHARGLKVITELVVNHTSDQHEWFQKSRKAKPGSEWRDYYVWSDDPKKYKEVRIIFKDFEGSNWAWDPVAKSYYWHRFYHHQPDLNYDNEVVQNEVARVMEDWFEKGVDGLRLDAVPYLFEREGTSCENLPETHEYLKFLRKRIDEKFPNKMLLAEANQWPEDAISYFGEGDECHMCFHFPLMPRLFMALKMEDRFSIIDILRQTPEIPDQCQWATFLRNHDELTLEMVTDEERDYMYNMYASDPRARINLGIRRRLAPLLENDRRQIELLNALLFSLPGTPIIYYGDEIGMGDNIYLGDRHGVRTPFQWSPDRNAGFSRVNPQKLYLPVIESADYHYETVNVETQQRNSHSILWWMKNLITLRKKHESLYRGRIEFLEPSNGKVLCFLRETEDQTLLIVSNLSRKAQCVEMDLQKYSGSVPTELFGKTEFPAIGDLPYFITLGPYGYYWFELKHPSAELEASQKQGQRLSFVKLAENSVESLSQTKAKDRLESLLPAYIRRARWFGSKARKISDCTIEDIVKVKESAPYALFFLKVQFTEGDAERYLAPLAIYDGVEAERIFSSHPEVCLAAINETAVFGDRAPQALIADAFLNPEFSRELASLLIEKRSLKGSTFKVKGQLFTKDVPFKGQELPEGKLRGFEQSNTSVVFEKDLIVKLFRKLHAGENPDVEIGRFFLEQNFTHTPSLVGAITAESQGGQSYSLAMAQAFLPNEGDAWTMTLSHLSQVAEESLTKTAETVPLELLAPNPFDLFGVEPPEIVTTLMGYYLSLASLLGKRTAEMHLALATPEEDGGFGFEEFTPFYQRSLYQSLRNTAGRAQKEMHLKRSESEILSGMSDEDITELIERAMVKLAVAKDRPVTAQRIRIHGDYHLGQVLFTGKDFAIIDFEGEPGRSVSERKLKRSPLRDVAGMLRSFDYAINFVLKDIEKDSDREKVRPWLKLWLKWTTKTFLESYFAEASKAHFLPKSKEDTRALTEIYLLEKALYEINYELNNRPAWVDIPLEGIKELCLQKD